MEMIVFLHARPLQELPSPAPDVGFAPVYPVSTGGRGGIHSQSLHWGVAGCQTAQPPGSSIAPPGLHSDIQDPAEHREKNLRRSVLMYDLYLHLCGFESPRRAVTCSVMASRLDSCSFWYNIGLGCTAPVSK